MKAIIPRSYWAFKSRTLARESDHPVWLGEKQQMHFQCARPGLSGSTLGSINTVVEAPVCNNGHDSDSLVLKRYKGGPLRWLREQGTCPSGRG